MSELLDLAARVEALSASDREVDALIAATCRLGAEEWSWVDGYPAWEGRGDGRVYLEKGGPSFAAPPYTGSLDAAISLVPDGEQFGCGSRDDTCSAWAWCGEHHRVAMLSNAATPALALTAACLKARSAEFGNIGADGVQS